MSDSTATTNRPVSEAAARERAILARADAQWDALREAKPDFFACMEDNNPMLAGRGELLDLMEQAPNDAVFMFLFANYSMRLEIASITGRDFE